MATTTIEDQLSWLALRMIPGLGHRRAVPLVQRFKSAEAGSHPSVSDLVSSGLPGPVAQTIASGCSYEEAADQAERLKRSGAELITILDPVYPEQLRQIYDPPLVLFA